ncbi:MarR family winged helix-turn-helix transcriptional regulator [Aurantiacibacter rhizosphaerae]|uniref:MarR family transcriptional regulator n=1 Tax=Aurantiacibacter rhizosphaerae TaxID=2691582 RepID=A0A844XG11_9SPHN|nr:MarR family transcriptional regulator [Aurantiacibacter rhizosphaerae]MWV28592.1 MarR family transcriptional regulator [Aurantiacibacter rhizosphaerae]
MDDPLARYPGYSLRRAANATGAQLSVRLADLGLRQADASVLLILENSPDITASALGRRLDIQRANMVPLLKRMEEGGLIQRRAIDGKSQGLALTAKGRKARNAAQECIEGFENELLARVPAQHRAHLLPALNALWHDDGAS